MQSRTSFGRNFQDEVLERMTDRRQITTIYLRNRLSLRGRVLFYDPYVILLEPLDQSPPQMIYKSAIVAISGPRRMGQPPRPAGPGRRFGGPREGGDREGGYREGGGYDRGPRRPYGDRPREGGYPPREGGYPPREGGYGPRDGSYGPREGGYPPREGHYGPREGQYGPPREPRPEGHYQQRPEGHYSRPEGQFRRPDADAPRPERTDRPSDPGHDE